MFGLFTSPPPEPDIPVHVILEFGKRFEIDAEYAKNGESAGWLRFVGYHKINGTLYFEYEHTV